MENSITLKKTKRFSIREIIYGCFFIFIPFSQALTINIPFPLKISEIFLFIIILYETCTHNIINWNLNKRLTITVVLFITITFISVLINAFYHYTYDLTLSLTRVNSFVDSILKFFYIVLSFITLYATRYVLIKKPALINYFFWGAIISSGYAWYLFISGFLKLPVFLFPGMDANIQTYDIGFGSVIRCSTFKEGNYMGFYLVVSGITAILYHRTKLAFLFFITIITTFSTTAIFCSLLFFLIYLSIKYKQYKLKLFGLLIAVIIIIGLLMEFSPGFRTIFYNKVFGDKDSVENTNDIYSKTDRLNTALIALEITRDSPFFGVGPANFGLHYNHYNTLPGFDDFETKRIPNNIYVEVLSEYGGLAFIFFICFLYYVFKYGRSKSNDVLVGGLIASYIYFFAFPTFTMLFIWVFIGIVLA